MPKLSMVRRMEAVGFRAWPAASVHYDGSWAVRLTASHPSRRLNSVNPLDPADNREIERRIARIEQRFRAYERPIVFRMSPLAPAELQEHLNAIGWTRADETRVLAAQLAQMDLEGGYELLPVRDIGRFVDAAITLNADERVNKPGLTELLESIRPPFGMFLVEDDAGPAATALCVHDNEMAGLFEISVRQGLRNRGYGRSIVRAALRWAAAQGATTGWLQVEAANTSANGLYGRLGFEEVYRYVYRMRGD
ncbi:MAG: GNAT family N-acetyltransferase [Roseitalea sp.]|jgi:GNAT superfamily N-acetyltransferase|nr:GNAT family N-acetyltransferase [Roseitalea sp.]MBO6722603.1 GNAT family N-acetyltransferase [Roseitalea sp.]MBO6745108.1 GNAT family N-acetyltransferase [Roseitalea sp.]